MKPGNSVASIRGLRLAPSPKNHPAVVFARTLQNNFGLLSRVWRWIQSRQASRASIKQLRVISTVSLGEKRIVAVVEFDGMQFLVGGGAAGVALLAHSNGAKSFSGLIEDSMTAQKKQQARQARKRTPKPKATEIEKLA
jgi:flagellar biogenesis protein FliO